MSKVSVLITTHNSANDINACLDSIFNQTMRDFEIIVVDNGSKDDTVSLIKRNYSNLLIIENETNFGPAKARNQAVKASKADFILCLDSDIRIAPDFLYDLYQEMIADSTIAAIQPKVLNEDGSKIDTVGIKLTFLRRFFDRGRGKNSNQYNKRQYVFGSCSAACLYRRKALYDISWGGEYFDENFFYLVEDVDLSWRLQKKGWRIAYIPRGICWHKGGSSRNPDSFSRYLCFRNRYLMMIKNESAWGILKFIVIFFLYDSWRALFMALVNPKHFIKAIKEVRGLSGLMMAKRKTKENSRESKYEPCINNNY